MKNARRPVANDESAPVVEVLWLELADPTRGFPEAHRPLPGQRHPGLGLARETLDLQLQAARRLGAEALFTTPRWWHNAVLYERGGYRWATPEGAAQGARLKAELAGKNLAEASWELERRPSRADLGEMWIPLSKRLRKREWWHSSGPET
jgi:hypothetical protein